VQHQQPRHHTKLPIGLICLFVSNGIALRRRLRNLVKKDSCDEPAAISDRADTRR